MGEHTIEYRVSNKAARVDDQVANGCSRFAVAILQIAYGAMIAPQLLRIVALNITTVILEKVSELVV